LAVPMQIQKVGGASVWSRAPSRELQKYTGPSVNPLAFLSTHSCHTPFRFSPIKPGHSNG
jgi:hypothetical protein